MPVGEDKVGTESGPWCQEVSLEAQLILLLVFCPACFLDIGLGDTTSTHVCS